ncbi:hypothetical protein BJ875DRAFT_156380 [Amylocarpus encephaloides]|uniref:Zn(2)-C6 fungal-type domain-containing protein n=1 Tax=Amylocarpus encephaloides TaxID=45428 RepID=A0A9P8C8I6_9HELO|nr:hypothetical protein BJ875DRAFT_156380 [Amylocarpus encephaloides]
MLPIDTFMVESPAATMQDSTRPTPPTCPPEPRDPDHARNVQKMDLGPEGIKPMKRACNDCRQQKLRCDVVQFPFTPCSRCKRLGKNCDVDTMFKRIGRRDKLSEMQREIEELRWKLGRATQGGPAVVPVPRPNIEQRMSSGTMGTPSTLMRELGRFKLTGDLLDDLFSQFFTLYHQFLPFLDPQKNPDYYFDLCPVLGWSIAMVGARKFHKEPSLRADLTYDYVRLLWATIADIPHSYHVTKALCLLCFWPLPTEGLQKDPTSQLASLMMQIALQNMLHLDFKAQVPFRGELSASEQRDRLMTWAACNIVAESTSTSLGLPPNTVYEGVLGSDFTFLSPYQLPDDLVAQLRISQFCNNFTKTLYCNNIGTNRLLAESRRADALESLQAQYSRLQMALSNHLSVIVQLHLYAAAVHLHAFAFFLPVDSLARRLALDELFAAVCAFLQAVMNHETSTGTLLEHTSNFISQTIFSSTFVLVKLLNGPPSKHMDTERGKALFNGIILAAGRMSIAKDDLPSRVGTRVPHLWRALGGGKEWVEDRPDPTVLRIQSWMGVSHVYDCHWAWKEQCKQKVGGHGNGTALNESNARGACGGGQGGLGSDAETMEALNPTDWAFLDWATIPI